MDIIGLLAACGGVLLVLYGAMMSRVRLDQTVGRAFAFGSALIGLGTVFYAVPFEVHGTAISLPEGVPNLVVMTLIISATVAARFSDTEAL